MSKRIHIILFILSIFMIFGCSLENSAIEDKTAVPMSNDNLPIIHVDDDHFQAQGFGQKLYSMPAGKGLILDVTGYKIRIPEGLKINHPNLIQLIAGNNQYYSLKWQDNNDQYILTGQSLTPIGNAKPFTGFTAGQQIAFAIGFQDEKSQFNVLWVGMANVH